MSATPEVPATNFNARFPPKVTHSRFEKRNINFISSRNYIWPTQETIKHFVPRHRKHTRGFHLISLTFHTAIIPALKFHNQICHNKMNQAHVRPSHHRLPSLKPTPVRVTYVEFQIFKMASGATFSDPKKTQESPSFLYRKNMRMLPNSAEIFFSKATEVLVEGGTFFIITYI